MRDDCFGWLRIEWQLLVASNYNFFFLISKSDGKASAVSLINRFLRREIMHLGKQ